MIAIGLGSRNELRRQPGGQLPTFGREPLGAAIPSPALRGPLPERCTQAVHQFAAQHDVPVRQFVRGPQQDRVAAGSRAHGPANAGGVFIGLAQAKMHACGAHKGGGPTGRSAFDFSRRAVAVHHVDCYVPDAAWGPAGIKLGPDLPYPVRSALNGHAWAKQQLRRAGDPRPGAGQRLPLGCRSSPPPGALCGARADRRAGLLRPLGGAPAPAGEPPGPC